MSELRPTFTNPLVERFDAELDEDRAIIQIDWICDRRAHDLGCLLMNEAEDDAGLACDCRVRHTREQLLLPDFSVQGRVIHGEGVVGAIDEAYAGHTAGWKQRGQELHDADFAEHPVNVAQPGLPSAKLGTRLLEDEQVRRRGHPQHGIRDAPAQRFDAQDSLAAPTASTEVVGGVLGVEFKHRTFACGNGRR